MRDFRVGDYVIHRPDGEISKVLEVSYEDMVLEVIEPGNGMNDIIVFEKGRVYQAGGYYNYSLYTTKSKSFKTLYDKLNG